MLRHLAKFLIRVLFRVSIEGRLPNPQPERLLIIANHQSLLDGVLLELFLPYRPIWVVHTDIWAKWYFRFFVRQARHVIVDTTRPQAVRTLLRELEQGQPVGIFPEGRVTVTGGLMKAYDAAAFLAAKAGAAILPVAIDGAIYSWFGRVPRPFPRKLFPRIRLVIRPLLRLEMPNAPTGKQRRQILRRSMQRILEETLFAAWVPSTIPAEFVKAMRLYGPRQRILDDVLRQGWTYRAIWRMALALGRHVAQLTPGERRVGVLLPNSATTTALMLGLQLEQRVPALLNYSAGLEGVHLACVAAQIRTIVSSRTFLERLRLADRVGDLPGIHWIYLEDERRRIPLITKIRALLSSYGPTRWVSKVAKPEDPAVILFTSGSEGKPKGVVLSHRALLANVAQIKAVVEFSNRDKFLSVLPMFHAFGLTAGVLIPLLTGCRTILYPTPLHYRLIPEIAYDRDCTVLLGTPTFLSRYGQMAHPYDFYRLRYVVSGAERLPEEVRQLWAEKFGIRIYEGYGVTECAPVISVNTPLFYKPGTVGRPLPGVECRVTPVPGLSRGGCLHVRGPNLMLGYLRYERPGEVEPPSSPLGPGWYETGDVAEIDEEGYIRILGRLKRFVKIAGEMVALELAERLAAEASPKFPSAAVAVPDPARGEAIVLFTEDPALDRRTLVEAARRLGLPELVIPRRVEHLPKLPLLGSGKVDYVRLKEMAGGV